MHCSELKKAHCKKSVLKIQEYIHEGANLKFYIPEFFKFKLLIPEYSPIYRFWFQTAVFSVLFLGWTVVFFRFEVITVIIQSILI
jgi:hypothetical protein